MREVKKTPVSIRNINLIDAEHIEQSISTLSVKFIVRGTMLMKRESVLISYHKIDAHDLSSLFLSKTSWAQYNLLNKKNILI